MSSVAFDNIVPLGQDFVLDDMPFTLPFKSPLNRGDGEFDTYVKQSPKKYC